MANPLPFSSTVDFDALTLLNGERPLVRPITPASKPVIASAMRRLSPESIRRRFFAPRR